MNSKPIIALNWKMQLTLQEAEELANIIVKNSNQEKEIILFCSTIHLHPISKILKNSSIHLGGQNIYFENQGPYTGETAAFQLKNAHCDYVLLGHSERRHFFLEDYDEVNQKVHIALKNDLNIVLCIGESEDDRNKNITEMIVVDQLENALINVSEEDLSRFTITYEPIWAIGNGKTVSVKEADNVHQLIRNFLNKKYTTKIANSIRILYGGSINTDNIKKFLAKENIDGVLIGKAAIQKNSLKELIS